MADLNQFQPNTQTREYDELEKVLAERPTLKAPRHTKGCVMARIAALPQTGRVTATSLLTAKYPAPPIKYVPPAVQPLPEPIEEVSEDQSRRILMGIIFTGAWTGLCLLLLWVIWPAISNLIFGPPSDPQMQAHLATLQSIWDNVTKFLSEFITAYGSLLPTLLSGAVGLALMTFLLFGNNFRRTLQTE